MQPTPSPRLVELAQAHGVATEYWDWRGQHVVVPTSSIVAVLAALGVEASDDAAVEVALAEHADRPWRRTLPPTVVTRAGRTAQVQVHVPAGSGVGLVVELEDGGRVEAAQVDRWVPDRVVDGVPLGEATFELPGDLPLGWHRLVAVGDAEPLEAASATATLVVTPERLELPEPVASRRVVGLMAQLYQVRSATTWGVGDLRDLAGLATWAAAAHDADFVLVNPLHAAEPVTPMEASPYLPTTRRFVNPLYLHVEDVPEVASLDATAHRSFLGLAARGRALNDGDRIDRDAAWTVKREALRLVFDAGLSVHERTPSRSSAPVKGRACCGSPRGARSPTSTGCRSRSGRPSCRTPTGRACAPSPPPTPTTSTSTGGCSGSSRSSSPGRSARPRPPG